MTTQNERIVGLGGAALVVVAALLPWASITTVFGSISRNGIDDGGDGLFTAGLAIACALALWQGGKWLWLTAVGALAIVGIGLWDISDVSNIVDEVNRDTEGLARASVGSGLYLTVLGGVIVFAVGATQLQRSRRAPAQAAPLPPGTPLPPPHVGTD